MPIHIYKLMWILHFWKRSSHAQDEPNIAPKTAQEQPQLSIFDRVFVRFAHRNAQNIVKERRAAAAVIGGAFVRADAVVIAVAGAVEVLATDRL